MPYNRNTPEGRAKYNRHMRVYMREYMRVVRYKKYLARSREEWSDEDRRRNPALVRQFANPDEYRRARQQKTDHYFQALGRLGGRPRVLPTDKSPKLAAKVAKEREAKKIAQYYKPTAYTLARLERERQKNSRR
jgi:hypothetical protein